MTEVKHVCVCVRVAGSHHCDQDIIESQGLSALGRAQAHAHPIPHVLLHKKLPLLKVGHYMTEEDQTHVMKHAQTLFPPRDPATTRLRNALKGAFPEFGKILDSSNAEPAAYLQLGAWRQVVRKQFASYLLDWVEYFAGEGNLTAAMIQEGFSCRCFDVAYHNTECEQDLLTAGGFRAAVLATMFAKDMGDLWHGLVCSSWVFLSRSTTRRRAVPGLIWGDRSNLYMRVLGVREVDE